MSKTEQHSTVDARRRTIQLVMYYKLAVYYVEVYYTYYALVVTLPCYGTLSN